MDNEEVVSIGKIIILSLSEEEEEIVNEIVNKLVSRKGFQYEKKPLSDKLIYSNLEIHPYSRKVYHRHEKVELTYIEFEILSLLARSPGRVFSKETIYDLLWNEPYSGDYNIIMSHIRHIREKIEDDPSNPVYIQTVWGVGYRFNPHTGSDE
ncbi:MAG: response regulator transcription factor [Lachnospiraceae bacterium]|nr:response regulator transcription factor [Lachnospiraceae bacterium]